MAPQAYLTWASSHPEVLIEGHPSILCHLCVLGDTISPSITFFSQSPHVPITFPSLLIEVVSEWVMSCCYYPLNTFLWVPWLMPTGQPKYTMYRFSHVF